MPGLTVLMLTWICCADGLDLWLARSVATAGEFRWAHGGEAGWAFLYRYGTWPALLMGVAALGLWTAGIWVHAWRRHRRGAAFVAMVMLLGPGLLVNVVGKPHWGRPRPRQLEEFGGTEAYRAVWSPGSKGEGRTSFPSGHASMGFFLMVPFFLRLRRSPGAWAWLAAGLVYGGLMGAARVLQGAHFLSDVLWSGLVVYAVGWSLARVMLWQRSRDPRRAWELEALPVGGGSSASQPAS